METMTQMDLSTEKILENQVLNLQDRSRYFVGLLLLIASDGKIMDSEREMLIKIASLLDFEKEYCEEVIQNVLKNNYISKKPMPFSSVVVASSFIEDGFRLAAVDGEVAPEEVQWLASAALVNGISNEKFEKIQESAVSESSTAEWSVMRWWKREFNA